MSDKYTIFSDSGHYDHNLPQDSLLLCLLWCLPRLTWVFISFSILIVEMVLAQTSFCLHQNKYSFQLYLDPGIMVRMEILDIEP